MPVGRIPKMAPIRIGQLRVDALVDDVSATRTAEKMMLQAPAQIVEDCLAKLGPDWVDPLSRHLRLAYQSFLIQLPEANILVDCAVGEDGNYPLRPDWHQSKSDWLNHLGQAGLTPEDIDIVFLTHLHMDHTGWLTRLQNGIWQPSFPKARHFVSRVELDHWQTHASARPFMSTSFEDCVTPVLAAGLFEPIAAGTRIADCLVAVDLSGHSPGMLGLEYREEGVVRAAFCADLMHHPLQILLPDLSTQFCEDPMKAAEIRRVKLDQYAAHRTTVFCGHFPGTSAINVYKYPAGFEFSADLAIGQPELI